METGNCFVNSPIRSCAYQWVWCTPWHLCLAGEIARCIYPLPPCWIWLGLSTGMSDSYSPSQRSGNSYLWLALPAREGEQYRTCEVLKCLRYIHPYSKNPEWCVQNRTCESFSLVHLNVVLTQSPSRIMGNPWPPSDYLQIALHVDNINLS